MTFERIARKAIFGWLSWLRKRRAMKAIPGYEHTFTMEREAKRRHLSTAEIRDQRKRIVLDALAGKGR